LKGERFNVVKVRRKVKEIGLFTTQQE
jgi:hypothetical protein